VSAARKEILAAVRHGLGRGALDEPAVRELSERLAAPKPNLVPARVDRDHAGLVELFVEMAREAKATVAWLEGLRGAPPAMAQAVAEFLESERLPLQVRMAPDPALYRLPWADEPRLEIRRGPAKRGDRVSVTGAFAGIAETGTCMLTSGPRSPTTLNFLVDAHVIVLWTRQIVGSYEDVLARLRETAGKAKGPARSWMPRTVNFITGPSRSADIEQTIQMGAHGPRRLHILLIDGARAGGEGGGDGAKA
jgi:L-lactate dehydrogenase complex protein LldG